MNNKGFSLVELLVAVVILGVITGMTWPAIRRIQEDNAYRKYSSYGDILISAAKLYVDAFEEDIFLYDDDLSKMTEAQKDVYRTKGQLMSGDRQCIFITYQDFADHAFVKDINIDGITCNSPYTFVRVIKDNKRYYYKYYIACGRKASSTSIDPLNDAQIMFTLPDNTQYLPLTDHYSERCND